MVGYGALPPVDPERATVVFSPAESAEGHWIGAPCVHRYRGTTYLAVRVRSPEARGHTLEIHARTGEDTFARRTTITAAELGVESLERPALVTSPKTTELRLYLPVDHGENDWSIQHLGPVTDPAAFDPASATDVLAPADGTTDEVTVKDPAVITVGGQYYLFYAGHDGRSEQAHLATSTDGMEWVRAPTNPILTRAHWHDHHTRVSCVQPAPDAPAWLVFYEGSGRADYGKTWNLRTGLAISYDLTAFTDTTPEAPWLSASSEEPGTKPNRFDTCRYLDVLDHDDRWEVFFEVARSDGAFELRRSVIELA